MTVGACYRTRIGAPKTFWMDTPTSVDLGTTLQSVSASGTAVLGPDVDSFGIGLCIDGLDITTVLKSGGASGWVAVMPGV